MNARAHARIWTAVAVSSCCLFTCTYAVAQSKPAAPPAGQKKAAETAVEKRQSTPAPVLRMSKEERAALQAKAAEATKPVAAHKVLQELGGTWEAVITIWPGPGEPPVTGAGIADNEVILDGRFLLSRFKTTAGIPKFDGLIVYGYDRTAKTYTLSHFSTWATNGVSARGRLDDATHAIVMEGEHGVQVPEDIDQYNMIVQFVSVDEYLLEYWFKNASIVGEGAAYKLMEIRNTRKPKVAAASH